MKRLSRRVAVVVAGVLSATIGVSSPAHAEEFIDPQLQIDVSDFAEDNESDQKALAIELAGLADQQDERDRIIAELRETEDSAAEVAEADEPLPDVLPSDSDEQRYDTEESAEAERASESVPDSAEPEAHVVTAMNVVDADGVFVPAVPKPVYFLNNPLSYMYVTSNYGSRYHPTLHYTRLHAGTDLRAPCGTPVIAAQSGIVVSAKWNGTGGNTIMIDHGTNGEHNIKSRYLHLSKLEVKDGQTVTMGDQIGLSGMTGGISTGCHLHFEVLIDDQTVDPLTQLQYELPAPFVVDSPITPVIPMGASQEANAPMPAEPIRPDHIEATDESSQPDDVADPDEVLPEGAEVESDQGATGDVATEESALKTSEPVPERTPEPADDDSVMG